MKFHLLHDREDPENRKPAHTIFYGTTGTYAGAGSNKNKTLSGFHLATGELNHEQ
ncbi:hypothetical protein [Escherichia coli]|uniref:hypothetical protein n=1 Tax=Escherichia coli TaxID=562 RepID=UPI001918DF82|nr:hypothetical protein [Escherichia coli]MDL4644685.1 hypothetical protein [Escherichia coli]MEC5665535.1 hypothetical protein [Escherichia coli]MEC5708653.1 hypothetical protein [Escherichia coli]MEC6040071.1 hypothetical protein [Escherichia coli]HBH9819002.1 hypothetical protein [Escherichia coli]